MLVFISSASVFSTPTSESADTAIRIPRKNRIVGISMVCNADETRPPILESILKRFTQISVIPQMTPNEIMMPIKGGRPVMVLKMGTNSKPETPIMSIALLRWGWRSCKPGFLSAIVVIVCIFPSLIKNWAINTGITIATILGMTRLTISPTDETFSSIHNMMVVTSPIGEKAPPALAAITIRPANIQRSFWSLSSRRSIITMIMVVVILSSTADMINDRVQIIHSKWRLLLALMCSVINEKPPYRSMISTIVMAPIRKTTISQASPNCVTMASCMPGS